jgi:DNA-binding MarR family transcriptional regulator
LEAKTTTTQDPALLAAIELRSLNMILSKLIMRQSEQRLAELGIDISHLQYGLLRVISLEPRTLSELSRHFMLDPSTMVPMVDALERRGYVERRKDPQDRRRAPLVITDAGQAVLERVGWLGDHEPLREGVRALGDERARELVAALRVVIAQMPGAEQLLVDMDTRIDTLCQHMHKQTQDDAAEQPLRQKTD